MPQHPGCHIVFADAGLRLKRDVKTPCLFDLSTVAQHGTLGKNTTSAILFIIYMTVKEDVAITEIISIESKRCIDVVGCHIIFTCGD